MAEGPQKPHHEELPFLAHALRQTEIRERTRLDFEKIAADFAKLLVSNLLILNAGALGAIPAISLFAGVQTLPIQRKLDLFICPGIAFAFGALMALLCGFVAYLNYAAAAGEQEAQANVDAALLFALAPFTQTNETSRASNLQSRELNQAAAGRAGRFVRRSAIVGIVLGLLSLVGFIEGSWLLFSALQHAAV